MINFSGVSLRRGRQLLLEDFRLTLHAGQRVGVVGRNGTGKSSLLALLRGEIECDEGEVSMPADLRIASVMQETPGLPQPALEFVLDGDFELRAAEAALAEAEAGGQGGAIAAAHEALQAQDGYAAEARAARLLHGLGFAPERHQDPVASFSGGWRVRLNLARALVRRSDLLLLDEPSNHLDLDAVLWLGEWLAAYPGTLLVVSHDRDFLDAVTGHTLHLEQQRATLYSGNYSSCERQRAERMAQQAATHKAQQRRSEQLRKFIDRFRAKASKARQAQSRIKQLERMEMVEPAHWVTPFQFEFLQPARLPAPLLRIEAGAVGYGGQAILAGLALNIEPGDRIGLLGRNGAGKSTLIRLLAGELPLCQGRTLRDRALAVAHFAQHQVDALDGGRTALQHLRALDETAPEQALRDFLGGFDFRGARVDEPVAPFSGGEKARLALALVVYQRPNLLLLDEPTNHLDIEMRYALERALTGYAGAVVLVSHDRHLLNACCDTMWLVAEGGCREFDGDLEDYGAWLRQAQRVPASAEAPDSRRGSGSQRARRQQAAAQREREQPLRAAMKRHEREMARLQLELDGIEAKLADPAAYADDAQAVAGLVREQGRLSKALALAEEGWLTALDTLENGTQSDEPGA